VLEISATEEVAGQVAWNKGDQSGIEFHQKLCPGALLELIGPNIDHLDKGSVLRDQFGRGLPDLPYIRVRPA
jgi:hypothetical protein